MFVHSHYTKVPVLLLRRTDLKSCVGTCRLDNARRISALSYKLMCHEEMGRLREPLKFTENYELVMANGFNLKK